MSDMRLIVAGAGGRMGRTLVRAIAETPGLMLTGATEGPELAPLLRAIPKDSVHDRLRRFAT